jgi:PD-(D/E)XK nuclease superfamily
MIALVDHSETAAANQPDGRRTIAELTKTVSASRLSTWQHCRLQFYFRYVAGIQKSPTPALHIGTTVHTLYCSSGTLPDGAGVTWRFRN